jgi:hypothetical protein
MSREYVMNRVRGDEICTLVVSTLPKMLEFESFLKENEADMRIPHYNPKTTETVYGGGYLRGSDSVFMTYQLYGIRSDDKPKLNAVVTISSPSRTAAECEAEELIKRMGEADDPLAVQGLVDYLKKLQI